MALTEAHVKHLIWLRDALPTPLKEAKVRYPPRYHSTKQSVTNTQTVTPLTVSHRK